MGVTNLDADEVVIMQASKVMVDTSTSRVDLVLTNKNLIQVNRGVFGADKGFEKYPLYNLKVYKGKANVIVGKNKHNFNQLELYFLNCEKFYRFDGLLVEKKWASAIVKAHKKCMDDIEKTKQSVPNQKGMFRALSETFNSAKGKVIIKRNPFDKTMKCPKCGAELNGQKGETVSCIYCNSNIVIM